MSTDKDIECECVNAGRKCGKGQKIWFLSADRPSEREMFHRPGGRRSGRSSMHAHVPMLVGRSTDISKERELSFLKYMNNDKLRCRWPSPPAGKYFGMPLSIKNYF